MIFFYITIIIIAFSCSDTDNKEIVSYPWSNNSLEKVLFENTNKDKIIFIDFYSNSCEPCIEFEKKTLSDKRIINFANNYLISIKINIDNKEGEKVFNDYDGSYVPLFVFLNERGEEIRRIEGYENADDFFDILEGILSQNIYITSLDNRDINGSTY